MVLVLASLIGSCGRDDCCSWLRLEREEGMVGAVVRITATARGAGLCIWATMEIMGMKEEDMVIESITKIEKMDTIIFLLIQEFDFFFFLQRAK